MAVPARLSAERTAHFAGTGAQRPVGRVNMMSKPAFVHYTDEVHRNLGYIANWPPGATLELGAVGIFNGRELEPNTTLRDCGIEFTAAPPEDLGDMGFVSDGAVVWGGGGSASASGLSAELASAGVAAELRFNRANAVFFRGKRAKLTRIDDLETVKQAVLRLAETGEWRKEWRFVTQVVEADECIVMVSNSADSSADLHVAATVLPEPAQLAKGGVAVEVSATHGAALSFGPARASAPLFQAYRVVKRPLLTRRTRRVNERGRLRPKAAEPPEAEDEFDIAPHLFEES